MAREAGASVLLLESAPRAWRGGNSQHTRNLRCMHDAPQDVLTDAYPEEEYWQDLLKVTGGLHRRNPGAAGDPRIPRPAATWMRRHGVRFQPLAVGHAATVAHQRLLHGRRQGAGQRLLPQRRSSRRAHPLRQRRWTGSSSTDGRFVAALIGRRAHRRRSACVVACGGFESNREWHARGLGADRARRMDRRQFPDPRHALQQGRAAEIPDRRRRRRHRRSHAGALRGHRRARAACTTAASAPASTACRWASSSTATPSASTTRARTSGPSATRSGAGWWRSSPGRSPTRSSTPRPSGASCRRCSPARKRPIAAGTCAQARAWTRRPWCAPCATTTRPAAPGTFDHTALDDCRTDGLDAAEDALGAPDRHATVLRLSAAARHHLHLPRRESERAGRGAFRRTSRAPTCSPPAKSWRATCSARAIPPGSA